MKLHDILSARLPEIGDSVKECVNLGEWLLFKTEASVGRHTAAFYLKTDDCIFELDDSGRLLQEVTEDADKLEIDELFYFADISRPTSLSNTRL
ncbi:hypothetical protein LU640_14025 [Pseudomonas monteilii]|uniref:hypothetical protein n=1 Tax=Pseudomonas monteilii TaxID=76759 RepID=UPI001E332A3A|nr:hypothetical protein [Pseudomonas monteilii]MCE1019459.1 hypothetical protein [Pseudomonas monteilii]MCE1035613.1 hypothetical protein [Pseudomonas monteilii]MCE1087766.1 hypothetical protein [Pseudomonas monteilii]